MKPNKTFQLRSSLAAVLAILAATLIHFAAPSVFAATYYWDGNNTTTNFGSLNALSTWTVPTLGTTTNGWSTSSVGTGTVNGNSITTTTSDILNFGTDAGSKGLGGGTLTISGTVDAATLRFGSQTTANKTLSGGTINLAPVASIHVGAGGTTVHTISSTITGAGTSLTKTGNALTLSGSNSFSGETIIRAGTLTLGNPNALQNTSGITMTNGTILRPSVLDVTITTGITNLGGTVTVGAPTINGNGDQTFKEFILNGGIHGSGDVKFNSTLNVNTLQTVVLGAPCTYSGNTLLDTASTGVQSHQIIVKLGTHNALPPTTVVTIDGQTGQGSGRAAEINLFGYNQTLAGLTNITRSLRVQRVVNSDISAPATLTLSNSTDCTFSGNLGSSAANFSVSSTPMPGSANGNNFGLTKDGTGMFTLSGSNPFYGATKVLGGILSLGHASALSQSPLDTLNSIAGGPTVGLQTTVTTLTLGGLTGNQDFASLFETTTGGYGTVTDLTLNPVSGASHSYSGTIADGFTGMTLTKSGAGTQTLTGGNNWTGATTVRAGKLVVTSLPTGTGALTVTNNATLAITAAGAGPWTPASLTVDTCTLEFNNVNTTTAPLAPTAAVVTPVTNVTINFNSLSGSPAVGQQFALIGNVTDATGYSIGLQPPGYGGSLVVNANVLCYQVDAINDIWTGTDAANPTFWNIGTSTNWAGNAAGNIPANTYAQNDSVLFDDTASTYTVAIQTPVTPTGVNFNNSATDYTVTGSGANVIGGTSGLTKLGTAKVTLLGGEHSYSGGTIISAGTLQLGNGTGGNDAALTNTSSVLNNSALVYHRSAAGSATYPIAGTGTLTKDGAGTMTLLGTNTYNGGTTIGNGTLEIGGSGSLNNGSYAGSIVNEGTLRYASSAAQTLSGLISGSGAVTKANTSTLTLTGGNTFSGQLTVENGKVDLATVNNISSSGPLGSSALPVILGSSGNTGTILANLALAAVTGSKPFTLAAGGTGEFEIPSGKGLTLTGVIDGSGNLIKSGPGGLTLSGANTFTGPVSVSLGTLSISGSGYPALGGNNPGVNGPANITVASGATLSFAQQGTGATTANYYQPITLNTATLSTSGGGAGNTLNLTLHGGVTLGGSSLIYPNGNAQVTIPDTTTVNLNAHTLTVTTDGSLVSTIAAPISGTGSIIKTSASTLALSGNNSYSGGTTIGGGVLILTNSASAAGTGPIEINGGVRLQIHGALTITNPISMGNNAGTTGRGLVEAANTAGAGAVISGPVNISSSATAGGHFYALNDLLTVSGPITATVPVAVRNGTVVLSGGGTGYTDLTLNQGTLKVGANNGIATTALLNLAPSGAGAFDLNGFNQSLVNLFDGGSAANATVTNSSTTNPATLTLTGGIQTYGGKIMDDGALGKLNLTIDGANLTLSGANSYTGNTTVSNGTLQVNGSSLSATTVKNGATLGGSGAVRATVTVESGGVVTAGDGTTGKLTVSDLTFSGTGTVNIGALAGYSSVAAINVTNALTLNGGAGAVTINLPTTTVASGTYHLLQFGGGTVNTSLFTLGTVPTLAIRQISAALQVNGNYLDYVITGEDIWTGAQSTEWSVNTLVTNWAFNGSPDVYFEGDSVLFNNTATTKTVDISVADVFPATVLFTNTTGNDYTVQGTFGIAGTTSLTKRGDGTVTLNNVNTFTGGTTVSAGTLALGSATDSLADTGAVTVDGATAILSIGANSDSVGVVSLKNGAAITGSGGTLTGSSYAVENGSVSAILGGTGAVTKTTTNTVTLSGANTYTGTTTVSAGTLAINNRDGVSTMGTLNVAGTSAGNLATVGIGGGTLNFASGRINLAGQGGGVGDGIINQTGGTVTFTGGDMVIIAGGGAANPTGTYNLSGGSIDATGVAGGTANRGVLVGANATGTGVFNLSGTGSLLLGTNIVEVARGDGAPANGSTLSGTFNQTGGSAQMGILSIGGNSVATSKTTNVQAYVNLTGGTFVATNFLRLANGGGDTNAILIGGTADVTLPAFPLARGPGSINTLTLDGGTLRPLATSANYLQAGTFDNAYLTTNGANIAVATGNDITVAQVLQDAPAQAGKLTKSDAGVLTLTGTNTYTGNTTVSNGTLVIAVASIAANSTVTVASGAVLQLDFATTNRVAGLVTNGVSLPLGVYNAANAAPSITGIGSLEVASVAPAQPTIAPVTVSGTNLVVLVPTVLGANYVLQSATNLTPTINWSNESTNAGTGADLILSVPIEPGQPQKFLRFWVY